ncbi:hypothetical protein COB57_05060 [Candidatus Peregrinibacteria bacterium]|nr:MAG: hypothetical protein COB57_05060 [Candidatus Peregrinibacteria bacterium]
MSSIRLMPGEKILRNIHKDPFFLLGILFQAVLRVIAVALLFISYIYFFAEWGLDSYDVRLSIFLFLLIICFILVITFVEWMNEELDILIITNFRIILFIQHTLLKRDLSTATLEQIQDSKGITQGVFGTLFGIGTLEVQTAADHVQFVMDYIKNPEAIAMFINDLIQHRDEEPMNITLPEAMHTDLTDVLGFYRKKIFDFLRHGKR